jgi:hypothetical protein
MQPTDKRGDPLAFRRWCKRHPVYLDAFNIAARVLGEELALVTVIPLINGGFNTSDPCRAFIRLLGSMQASLDAGQLEKFLSYPEPLQWPGLIDLMLNETSFETDDEDVELLGSPFHRIDLSNWLHAKVNGEAKEHPFLTKKAVDWERRTESQPVYRWLLDQPAWVGDDVFSAAMRDFNPPLSFVIFHGPKGYQRVITTGDTDISQEMLVMHLTAYSVVHRASGVGVDPTNRLCHHSDCPEYMYNYCNAFPVIPQQFQDCRFLEFHAILSGAYRKQVSS